jgi:hypothetical protein
VVSDGDGGMVEMVEVAMAVKVRVVVYSMAAVVVAVRRTWCCCVPYT